MRDYFPHIRIHDPAYLVCQATQLKNIATIHSNSSSLIYACLELRTALERIDFELLVASMGGELEYIKYIDSLKQKNGIEQVNNILKTLKKKFQDYMLAIFEIANISGKSYDYNKSKSLQYELSQYIHTYGRSQEEINFTSPFMKNALVVIDNTINFINSSLRVEDKYQILNMEYEFNDDEIELFEKWKSNATMPFEDLVAELRIIIGNRTL